MPSPGLNLAKLLGTSSVLSPSDLDLGVIKQYATFADLPTSVADGERGYITDTSDLYIYLGLFLSHPDSMSIYTNCDCQSNC